MHGIFLASVAKPAKLAISGGKANSVRLLLAMCVNIDSVFSYLSENINSHPMPAVSGILELTRVVTKE